jgi:hypothetical protein
MFQITGIHSGSDQQKAARMRAMLVGKTVNIFNAKSQQGGKMCTLHEQPTPPGCVFSPLAGLSVILLLIIVLLIFIVLFITEV